MQVQIGQSSPHGGINAGPALAAFLDRVAPSSARQSLYSSAITVLSQCALNAGDDSVTGMVVGQVQSGKTMSYEALISLAHDSSFPVVIVISGISTPLLDQGAGRLRKDLSKASPGSWAFFKNPRDTDAATVELLRTIVNEWFDQDVPTSMRRTAVVSVLKHHGQLQKLGELLTGLGLPEFPVLIIDDEADQASLNAAVRRNRESTTFRVLKGLRAGFKTFSYVQFTATPQALLLINIANILSPKFVHVLKAGVGYVGGDVFFRDRPDLVRLIPPSDLPAATPAGGPRPHTLNEALRLFFLGMACEIFAGADRTLTRSMLIHPSQETDPHERFVAWVRVTRDQWIAAMQRRDDFPDDYARLMTEFESARVDLIATGVQVPELSLLSSALRLALKETIVIPMNATNGPTPQPPWEDAIGFVLVGGQAMDRGFTVEGLTVTYMPRGLGVGNADSIEQRARFFGYKQSYVNFCRVYLESQVAFAFNAYVEHEADIRGRLEAVEAAGQPLPEWRRAFILDRALTPTRTTVLSARALADELSNDWYVPPQISLDQAELYEYASKAVEATAGLEFCPDGGDPRRSDSQRHEVAHGMPISSLIDLLRTYPIDDEGTALGLTGLVVQLETVLSESPDERVTVYRMRPAVQSRRSLRANDDRVLQLFQGANPASGSAVRGEIYAGDRAVHSQEEITLQLHTVDLIRNNLLVAQSATVPATWIPDRLAKGWYVQEES